MEYYCPLTHENCTKGEIGLLKTKCRFWDEPHSGCLIVEQMRRAVGWSPEPKLKRPRSAKEIQLTPPRSVIFPLPPDIEEKLKNFGEEEK